MRHAKFVDAPSLQNTGPGPRPWRERIREHYAEAGDDYRTWSPAYNMHFGFWRLGMDPLDREAMLAEMTRQVMRRLAIDATRPTKVIDMGCGVGAPLRQIAGANPKASCTGATIVPWQIAKARALTEAAVAPRVRYELLDYTATGLPAASFDAALAMESACHDEGLAKAGFVKEAARLLKPGARLVVADGFLRARRVPRLLLPIFRTVSHNWAVETFASLPHFVAGLELAGFRIVAVENVSWRVGFSAMQAPFLCLLWTLRELLHLRFPARARWRHVLASLLAPVVGLAVPWFGYYVVTAERKGGA